MNKLLLLSFIKGLIFVLESSAKCNIDLSTAKKESELNFYSRFKIYVLMVSKLAFASKIIRSVIILDLRK